MVKMTVNCSPSELGSTILSVSNASRYEVPLPEDLKPVTKLLLDFFETKTWKSFAKGAKALSVLCNDSTVEIMPLATNKNGSFGFVPNRVVRFSQEAEEIGEFVLSTLLDKESGIRSS